MKQSNSEQYSPEWFAKRLGKFTSSSIWQLMVQPKEKSKQDAGELSQTAKEYVIQKVAERLTGIRREFNNDATAYGVQMESEAIDYYTLHTGNIVTPCGFIEAIEGVYGGTPDGLIYSNGDTKLNGSLQIKCPYEPKQHIYNCLTEDQDHFKRKYREYYWQMQSDIFVSGTDWCDFVSYCPHMPNDQKMFVLRIFKNEEEHQQLSDQITKAYQYLVETINKLESKFK